VSPSSGRQHAEVSVLIGTAKVDNWLDQAVWSVLQQSDVDLQVVVVHDGVLPNPLKPWTTDPRVEIIYQNERLGLAAALNSGLALARHELIARLDADDLCLPGRLASQAKKVNDQPDLVVVGGGAKYIDRLGHVIGTSRLAASEDVRRSLLVRNQLIHSSVMYRRSVLVGSGGYDVTLNQMEDYELWMRLAHFGRVARMPDLLVSYRRHDNQISNTANPREAHVAKILAARRALAKMLGVAPTFQMMRDAAWVAAQYHRHRALRPKRPPIESLCI